MSLTILESRTSMILLDLLNKIFKIKIKPLFFAYFAYFAYCYLKNDKYFNLLLICIIIIFRVLIVYD